MGNWRATVDKQFETGGIVLRLAVETDGKVSVLTDITLTNVEAMTTPPDNGLKLPHNEGVQLLQSLMDAAYDFGIRPSRAQDESHLKAHLEDMRTITMHKLGIRKDGGHR